MKLPAPKKPCAECPWRTDVRAGRFPAERYVELAATAYDMAMRLFACHKSLEGQDAVCAGFLLRGAAHSLTVRLALSRSELRSDTHDGGYPLFADYRAMAVANGVPADHPSLALCRSADR